MNHWLFWGLIWPVAGASLYVIQDERPGETRCVRDAVGRVVREYHLDGDGRPHGPETVFFPDGSVSDLIDWSHGEAVEQRSYHPSGGLKHHRYEPGLGFSQVVRTYDEQGRLVAESRL